MREEKWKEEKSATGEELWREMSKCLFMPNWATDEPAAISDSSPSRRKEDASVKEGREGGEVLQRRDEEQHWGFYKKNRCRKQ